METLKHCLECNRLTEHNGDFCVICGRNNTIADYADRITELMDVTKEQFDTIDKLNDHCKQLESALQSSSFIISTITLPPHYFTNVHLKN